MKRVMLIHRQVGVYVGVRYRPALMSNFLRQRAIDADLGSAHPFRSLKRLSRSWMHAEGRAALVGQGQGVAAETDPRRSAD